jgi:hypothetical protein
VRLGELKSVATVLAMLARAAPPTRGMNRHHGQLMRWFREHWSEIAPFIPLVQLRDEKGRPIDGQRELVERGLIRLVSGE